MNNEQSAQPLEAKIRKVVENILFMPVSNGREKTSIEAGIKQVKELLSESASPSQDKASQKQSLKEIMQADEKDGLYEEGARQEERCPDCGLELSEPNEMHDCDIYSTVMQYRKDHPAGGSQVSAEPVKEMFPKERHFPEVVDNTKEVSAEVKEDKKLKMLLSFIPFDEMGYQKFFHLAKEYLNELDERDHPQDVKDMIIQGMEEGAAEWQREAEDIALALTGLVILKDIKDKPNKSADEIKQYEMSKPEAWEEARKVLQRTQAGQRIKNKMQPYLDFLQSRPQTELEILNTRCGPPPDKNEGEEELIRQLKYKSTPKEEKEEWISVEKPPKKNGYYQVYDTNFTSRGARETPCIEIYRYDAYNDSWYWGADCFHPQFWMPLPAPPKQAEQNDKA